MLEYKVSLYNTKLQEHPIRIISIDVSEDMSQVSGVTYVSECINAMSEIYVSSPNSANALLCPIQTENHQRQGVLFIEDDQYELKKTDSREFPFTDGRNVSWEYIKFQNSFYYVYSKEESDDKFIDIPYIVNQDGGVQDEPMQCPIGDDNAVHLNYGLWIDDNKVTFKGKEYIVDKEYFDDSGNTFCLREHEGGDPVLASDLEVGSLSLYPFDIQDRYYVTYFWIQTDVDVPCYPNNVSCAYHSLWFDYNKKLRKCINLGTLDEPLWGIKNITNDVTNPISAVCYTASDNGEEIIVSGDTFSSMTSDDLYEKYNVFWTYLPDDATKTRFPLYFDLENSNQGRSLLVYVDDGDMKDVNTVFTCKDNNSVTRLYLNEGDEPSEDYVIYGGRHYYRKENVCDQVIINDQEFDIEYEDEENIGNGTRAFVNIHGSIIEMYSVSEDELEKRTTQIVSGESSDTQELLYPRYEVIHRDGVKIGYKNYPIIETDDDEELSGITTQAYVDYGSHNEYTFKVVGTHGSNIMIMSPVVRLTEFDDYEINLIKESICSDVYYNIGSYTFYYQNHLFAQNRLENGLGYIDEYSASSTRDFFNLEKGLNIYSKTSVISLDIPLKAKAANNLLIDDIQYSDFYQYNRKDIINEIVDMEKDVYYPMYPAEEDGEIIFDNGFPRMLPIYEIDVNLHFRTRNLDNWKVNESYTYPELCNWFVTDFPPYSDVLKDRGDELITSSDLLGLLNFENTDVIYQKNKLKKSFLRFSFYDSPDQQTQTLLDTSTIWMDELYSYKKYITNTKRLDDLIFSGIGITEQVSSHSIDVMSEPYLDKEYTLKDENRLSSRLVIKNKYENVASSEGFYLYIFKEYTQNLTPVPIYMKVEFNHAGIGQTLPFIVPMFWKEDNNGFCYPTRKITLNEGDVPFLKKGYALEDIYMQTYIPLYCAYDKINRQYFYYFDDRYVTTENGVVSLNLFEIKVADSDVIGKNVNKKFVLSNQNVTDNLIGNVVD